MVNVWVLTSYNEHWAVGEPVILALYNADWAEGECVVIAFYIMHIGRWAGPVNITDALYPVVYCTRILLRTFYTLHNLKRSNYTL